MKYRKMQRYFILGGFPKTKVLFEHSIEEGNMSTTKICSKCGVEKPIEEFGWKNRMLGKRHKVCKPCTAVRSSKWYYANKERQIKNVRNNNRNYRDSQKISMNIYLSPVC
jgi:hypothetical protein